MDSNPFDSSLVLSFADAVTTGKKGKQHKPRAAGKHTGDQAQINVLEPRILLANVISAVDPGIGGTTPFTRPGFIGINIANNLISPGTVTIQDDDAQIGPFITWNTDFDTGGFVTQAVMDVLEAAGNTITSGLMDTLDAIAPSGINTWTASFTHPGTGVNQQIVDLPVAENEYIIYVGGRNLGGSVSQSQPGSFAALSGNTQAFFDSVTNRGELGEDDDPPTDYADWGGSISFNDTQGFYHIGETTSGLDPGEFDLFTVAAQAVMRIF
ncbi:MAG: hypothetical protein QF735_10330, partial [Phycisphaeraceae bacterium]|nr:hypothetical protein [Phycisphaeraceae bacterium]